MKGLWRSPKGNLGEKAQGGGGGGLGHLNLGISGSGLIDLEVGLRKVEAEEPCLQGCEGQVHVMDLGNALCCISLHQTPGQLLHQLLGETVDEVEM